MSTESSHRKHSTAVAPYDTPHSPSASDKKFVEAAGSLEPTMQQGVVTGYRKVHVPTPAEVLASEDARKRSQGEAACRPPFTDPLAKGN